MKQIIRIWSRLPLIIRASVSGFFVSSVGVGVWGVLLAVRFSPIIIPPMILLLWGFWRVFGRRWEAGRWRVGKVGIAGAVLFVLIFQSCLMVTFRLIDFPRQKFIQEYTRLDSLPVWSAFLLIVMGSLVAGVAEEVGFRGYIQKPLTGKYGPALGIGLTSLVFTAIHLNHSWAQQIPLQIFFASSLLGVLAYKSNSLVPGIIGHSILDIFDYSIWWSDIFGGFNRQTIFKTGVDVHFVIWVALLVLGCFGFFRVIRNAGCR